MLTIAFILHTNTTIISWFLLPSNTHGTIKLLQYFLKAENRKGGEGGVGNTAYVIILPTGKQAPQTGVRGL